MEQTNVPTGAETRGKSKLLKWIVIYLLIGVVIYAILFLSRGLYKPSVPVLELEGTPSIDEATVEQAPAAEAEPAVQGELFAASIENFKFVPAEIRVKAGDKVVWQNNEDGIPHTVDSTTGIFSSGNMNPGEAFYQDFPTTGTYPYFCRIHQNMRGIVIVE